MRNPIQLLCGSILATSLATSCGLSTANSSDEAAATSAMEQALTAAVQQTPYAALIQNTQAQAEPLPDEDPQDDYALQRWSITARVLQTYRGLQQDRVHYTVDTEIGEEPGLGEEPFIIVLCQTADGYYWPGVGYNFPAGEREKSLAVNAAAKVDAKQQKFADCTD